MQQKGNPQLVPVKATLGEGMTHSIAKVMGVIIMFYQSLNQWLLHICYVPKSSFCLGVMAPICQREVWVWRPGEKLLKTKKHANVT